MGKNMLQEYCQKVKIPLPVYETWKLEGPSHQPVFQSMVRVTGHPNVYSEPCGTKKKAELSAAKLMLQYISDNTITTKYNTNKRFFIWIDMENIHMGDFFEHKQFNNNYKFIGFSTEDHPSIRNVDKYPIIIKTIRSSRSDACDILMVGYAGQVMAVSKYGSASWYTNGDPEPEHDDNVFPVYKDDTIIIVTKDHFGDALVEYIEQSIDDTPIKAINLKSVDELDKYLLKYSTNN